MKHKMNRLARLGTILLIVILCVTTNVQALDWTVYQNSSTNNGVTENPGPTDAGHSVLKWSVKMPDATTPPLIIGDRVYTASGRYVYCYDKATGVELGKSDELKGRTGFALHPMVYADNCLFVVTVNGGSSIEALDLSN
ncbi:MAG: PQQ-binding-like beta-propeller repeat protein, partial [Eubacteriaceae bacterium]|nr:PQQ-binding-like beta-propeller repeat protein [Eubacteriaceae bacterium]